MEAQPDAVGTGGGWFDCNNDGYLDVCYVSNQGRITLLMYNPGSHTYDDQTTTAIPEVIQSKYVGMGVTCGDINNDGWSDLFLTFSGPNQLLLNNKDDTFILASKTAGIRGGESGEVTSASAAFFDYDNDGLLDIYVANYEGFENQLFHNTGIDESGLPHFVDVAPDLGMDWAPNGQSNWSLGIAVADYDNDHDLDLYLINDYDGPDPDLGFLKPGPNILYRNNGDGTFVDFTEQSGAANDEWGMGGTFGDYDGDGWLDLFVTNFWVDALFHNNRDGTFTDVTALSGMPTTYNPLDETCTVCNGWGTSFIDFDNDGDLDIHVSSGFISNSENQAPNQANQLWENVGKGGNGYVQFVEVGEAAGIADVGDGRGAAYGDFNADGFVDILLINNNFYSGPYTVMTPQRQLFVNQKDGTFREMGYSMGIRNQDNDALPHSSRGYYQARRWLEIRPVGTSSNAAGYGARVTVEHQGRKWVQDLGVGSFCSTSSPYLHFGLGGYTVVDRITVRFLNGTEVVKTNQATNRILTITEDDLSPVRLLSFQVTARTEGALLEWSFSDDGDVAAFAVGRIENGNEIRVAPAVRTDAGQGNYLDTGVPSGVLVTYVLDALYRDGSRERVGSRAFRFEHPLPVTALGQNHPNPFSLTTAIPIMAAPGAAPRVLVFDARGRLVHTLRPALAAGVGTLSWDGRDATGRLVPAGAYFYRLEGTRQTHKMIRRP